MKFSIRTLVLSVAIASVLIAAWDSYYRPVRLELNMEQIDFESALLRLNAESTPLGSVGTFGDVEPEKSAPTSCGGIWEIPRVNLTIEADFEDDQLKELNVWDWNGRRQNSYLHNLEHDCVSSLTISLLRPRYTTAQIE